MLHVCSITPKQRSVYCLCLFYLLGLGFFCVQPLGMAQVFRVLINIFYIYVVLSQTMSNLALGFTFYVFFSIFMVRFLEVRGLCFMLLRGGSRFSMFFLQQVDQVFRMTIHRCCICVISPEIMSCQLQQLVLIFSLAFRIRF